MGCGRRAPKAALVRLVVAEGTLVADRRQRLPGRGAYLCPAPACWERARSRRTFARALRRAVTVPDDALDLKD